MKADFASRFALPLVVTTVVGCGSPRTATSVKSADLAAPAQSADATSQRCDGARRAVASLDSPLRITAYVSSGTPELDRASAEVRAALERLKASGPRVDDAIVNTLEADGASRARAAGMLDLRNTETGDDRADRFMGLTFEYGSERDKIALFPVERISSFEFEVLKRVALLRARALRSKHRLGVLTGHGEIGFAGANLTPPTEEQPPTLQGIAATYSPHVELVDVDLGRSSSIDETLEGLIITQPTTDIRNRCSRRRTSGSNAEVASSRG